MCGRFPLRSSAAQVAELFRRIWELVASDGPRFNIAPPQSVLPVRQTSAGREPSWLKSGLIPAWVNQPVERLLSFRIPYPADELRVERVNDVINDARNDVDPRLPLAMSSGRLFDDVDL